jgi:ABC-2 type transport system permease protein
VTAGTVTQPGLAPRPHPPLLAHLVGIRSVFAKTVRDSRLGIVLVTALLGSMIVAGGSAMAGTYGTLETRRELSELSSSLPPVMTGLYGNPVNVDTLGGFVTWHYGGYIALLAGLWSILALSSTLAGEARRGSLEFIAVAPLSRIRIALEKVTGHIVALSAALALVGAAAWMTGAFFATMPGDEISPAAAVGFSVGLGFKALLAGSVAFALASFVGRGAAAGLAGALMLAGYVVTAYRTVIPAFDSIAGASWFTWTADHLPLAGRWDWPAVAVVALGSLALLGVGVAAFARSDVGATSSIGMPGMPAALLGLRGPIGRSFGERLPAGLAWGVGLGLYALIMATASRSFVDELARTPSLAEVVHNLVPGIDLTTAAGFLEVLFIDFGLVLVGLAAATLVAGQWEDETSGRLELLLATTLSRVRWAVSSTLGVWLALMVVVAIVGGAIGIGVAAAGGEVIVPMAGALAVALYALAMAGIGFAVGGVAGASLAGRAVAAVVIATFLVDILGPALELPDWVHQLALSTHLGQPMVGTWDPAGVVACLVLAASGLALGAWGMGRRDVAD